MNYDLKNSSTKFFEFIWDTGIYLMCIPLVSEQEPFYIARFFSFKNDIKNMGRLRDCLAYNDMTLLHCCVKKKMLLYCKALIKYGFDINKKALNGITPKLLSETVATADIKALFDSVHIQVLYSSFI